MLSAGKLGALLGLLLLASPIAAVPTGLTARDGTLHPLADTTTPVTSAAKDPLPKSKADLKTKFFKAAPKKDKSCFFTGMDIDTAHNPAQNTQEAKKQCKAVKLTTLDQIWTKNNIVNPGEWQRPFTNDEFNQVLGWISEVFAEETSGVAYLLIPHGSEARKQSIFYSIEYKAMKDGGKVDKIKRVDFAYGTTPTLPNADDDNNLWWKKGAADPPTRPDPPAASSSAPAPAPTPAPAAVTLTCAGTGGSKYINRDGIMKVIDTFCDEAAKQGTLDKDSGSIARNYHKDTPEEVNISMDYRPGLNWRPMKDKCVEQMMIVTDGCDTNSNHWKGGGARKDTDVTYRWSPAKPRSVPVEQAKVWGGCEGTYGGYYTVWGAHWAADDYGSELLNNLKGKGISPTQWKFNYGGGDDHREWTANFQTIIHAWPQVESSMESVGGWGLDIGCKIG